MDHARPDRKLTAILSADVAGYSRLMGADEEGMLRRLAAYRKVFADHIQRHGGRIVNAPGDALLAEFASVVDAVTGAVEIQRELAARNAEVPEQRRMHFRIGVHLGNVLVQDDDIFGDGVNIAARLDALADPGGICVSGTAIDQVEGKLPLQYEYQGEQQVKNIVRPVRTYRVSDAAGPGTGPPPGCVCRRSPPSPCWPSTTSAETRRRNSLLTASART